MPEFNHHLLWLQPVSQAIAQAEKGSPDVEQLRSGIHICNDVLSQNPGSVVAREFHAKIDALLRTGGTQSVEGQTFLGGWGVNEVSVKRMDELIAVSEQKFSDLGEILSAKIDPRTLLQKKLLLPFDYVRANHNFAQKNSIANRLQAVRTGKEVSIEMETGNFMYDLHPGILRGEAKDQVAGFNNQSRQFQVAFDYAPERKFDLFVKYHEIWHAHQDDWLRTHVSAETYKMLSDQHAVTIDFEFEAYAYMLEAIDHYFDGEFHDRCQTQSNRENVEWLQAGFGLPDQMRKASEYFFIIGRTLWADPEYRFAGDDCYPQEFERFIINNHRYKNLWKKDNSGCTITKILHS